MYPQVTALSSPGGTNVLAFRRPVRQPAATPSVSPGTLPWMSIPTDPSFTTDRARRLAVHLGITEAEAGWAITNIWRWATNARRDGYLGDTDGVDLLIEGRLEHVIDAARAGQLKDALVRAAVIDADGFLTDWNLLGGRLARNAADRQAAVIAPNSPGSPGTPRTRASRSDFPSEEAWKSHTRQLAAERARRRPGRQPSDPVTLVTPAGGPVTLPAPRSVTEPGGFPDQSHASPRLGDSGENGEGETDGATAVSDLSHLRLRSGTGTAVPASRHAYIDAMREGGVTVLTTDRLVAEIIDPVSTGTAIRLAKAMLSVAKWGSERLKANPNLRWVSQDLGKYAIHEERLARLDADEERRRHSITEAVAEVTERGDFLDVVDVTDPEWPEWFVAWRGAVKSTATGGLWAFARSFLPDPSGGHRIIVPSTFVLGQVRRDAYLHVLQSAGDTVGITIGADTFRCADGARGYATQPGSSGRVVEPAVLTGSPEETLGVLVGMADGR